MCPYYLKDPKYDHDTKTCSTCARAQVSVTCDGVDINCPHAHTASITIGHGE